MNVEVGLRVVRGPDWKWGSQDGGEGFVGTVVEIGRAGASSPDETVIVRWDSGTKTNYRIGYQDAYDLRVVDNAPVGVKHVNIVCDGCKKRGILGIRWRCTTCDDYDLCTPCYMSEKHDVKHSFVRYDTATARGVDVGKRKDSQKVMMQGIFVGAKVQRGPDWDWGNQDGGKGKVGRVVDIRGWDGESGRSVANVIWASGITNVYRVGHKGKVDLTVATPGKNGYYYPEQLPVLGKKEPEEEEVVGAASARQVVAPAVVVTAAEAIPGSPATSNTNQGGANSPATSSSVGMASRFTVGEKVTVISDIGRLKVLSDGHGGWNPKMGECVGKIGVVHRITDRGDVRVQFGGRDKWTFHPTALTRAPHEFTVGDVVRVIDDRPTAVELQRGHGEWADSMCNALGKVGRVLKVYADRDLRVCVDGATWTLNPLCVSLVPGSAVELFNTMGSNHHRRDDSDHQNPLPSLSSYLDGAMAKDVVATISPVPCPTGNPGTPAATAIASIQARLSRAAAEGDLRELADLLRQFPDAANSKINGKTILQVACHQGHLDVIRFLLSSPPSSTTVPSAQASPLAVRVDVEAADDEGDTPLHYAAFGNQPEVMELLVQKGANINAVNKARCTPLHVVVNKQFAACTRVLLRHGADVNMQDSYGDTALHDAIGKDSGEILVLLASVPGCDFSIKNTRGFNALHHAALKGNNLAVEKILERSRQLVDVRKDDGFTALHLAALNGHLLVARTLFCLGHCQLDARNNRGQTALMLAASQAHVSVVDLLVRADGSGAGPTLAATDDDEGDTAAHVSLIKSQGSLTPLASPLTPGAPVNVASVHEIWQELSRGSGGPEMAAMAISCFLVSRGAPLNARNRKGKTPLDLISSEEWKAKLLAYAQYHIAGQSAAAETARPVDGAASVVSEAPPCSAPSASSSSTAAVASGVASSSGTHRSGVGVVDEGQECIVCSEAGAVLVRFLPCGHVVACRDCSVRMKKCLHCGLLIAGKIGLDEPVGPTKGELVEELAMLQQLQIRGQAGYVDMDGAFVSAARVRELEEKIAEMEETQTCSICLERRKNVVFLCGHGACVACSATLAVCHMCRAVITRKINVY